MNHEEWIEQADIYALGALDGDELTQFEAHLAKVKRRGLPAASLDEGRAQCGVP